LSRASGDYSANYTNDAIDIESKRYRVVNTIIYVASTTETTETTETTTTTTTTDIGKLLTTYADVVATDNNADDAVDVVDEANDEYLPNNNIIQQSDASQSTLLSINNTTMLHQLTPLGATHITAPLTQQTRCSSQTVLPFYLWNDNSCGIDTLYVILIILTIRYNILQEQQQENKQQYDTLSHLDDASLPVVEQAHLARSFANEWINIVKQSISDETIKKRNGRINTLYQTSLLKKKHTKQ
jgi:hypothetical protein